MKNTNCKNMSFLLSRNNYLQMMWLLSLSLLQYTLAKTIRKKNTQIYKLKLLVYLYKIRKNGSNHSLKLYCNNCTTL